MESSTIKHEIDFGARIPGITGIVNHHSSPACISVTVAQDNLEAPQLVLIVKRSATSAGIERETAFQPIQ